MKSEKLDVKKLEKDYYFPKKITLVDIPKMNFIMVDGEGAPTGAAFQEALALLYPVAFTISMSYRNEDFTIDDFEPFVVPPLEGLWTSKNVPENGEIIKEDFIWRLMIRMPDFVTVDVVEKAKQLVFAKKKLDVSALQFGEITDGLCLQTLHIGSFDNEAATFSKLFEFAQLNKLKPVHKTFHHREIYMSDFRRTKTENLKTVLRIFVEKEA
ncbi:GyrI-like domain-containing protein [Lactococcus kimchii]|uniref:GyrI-like domain-containing protein n=1 Tax=Lactococcus sp. S-13 TaxID=2507158 RepID=UPI001023904B|nr:GyrI-like domain-containing protein [Lactococcus sp. S-13]RZI49619.1 hypothetical protein EQJ87_09395 [Lactococcus sp. S-13]